LTWPPAVRKRFSGLRSRRINTALVRRREPPADLHAILHHLARGERATLEPTAQRLAFQKLEDDAVDTLVGVDVVDGKDVGVVEGGEGAGLALEAAQPLGVGGGVLGEDLEGDLAAEAGVAGPVDFPHAPGAEGCEDLVRADAAARG
jgi:hypothetical protein